MKDILLRELSSSDFDWILDTGRRREIPNDTIIVPEGQTIDTFDILLDGTLSFSYLDRGDNPLADAFAKLEENNQDRSLEIFQFSSGEIIGEDCLLGKSSINSIEIRARDSCSLVSIPLMQLEAKIDRDAQFASRFYRAIATILANRMERAIAHIGRRKFAPLRTARDVLFIFGQLHDSDIDWAVNNGVVRQVTADKILVRQGTPVDTLYILLEGSMKASISDALSNPLTRVFDTLEENKSSGRELTKLYQGEILGETTFIDGRLFYATIEAIENSFVLAITRQQLTIKLQQDAGFATRFYRAIATLLSYRLQEVIFRMGYGQHTYSQNQSLDENELDSDLIEQISLAATRFNSMLSRLGCLAK